MVDIDDICRYISELKMKGCKDSTVKRKIVSLKLLFEYMYREKLIPKNPFFENKFTFKQEKRLPKTLTIKEVSKLLAILSEAKATANTPFSIFETTRDMCLLDLLSAPSYVKLLIFKPNILNNFSFKAFVVEEKYAEFCKLDRKAQIELFLKGFLCRPFEAI